jgi:hypothetical protein
MVAIGPTYTGEDGNVWQLVIDHSAANNPREDMVYPLGAKCVSLGEPASTEQPTDTGAEPFIDPNPDNT